MSQLIYPRQLLLLSRAILTILFRFLSLSPCFDEAETWSKTTPGYPLSHDTIHNPIPYPHAPGEPKQNGRKHPKSPLFQTLNTSHDYRFTPMALKFGQPMRLLILFHTIPHMPRLEPLSFLPSPTITAPDYDDRLIKFLSVDITLGWEHDFSKT